MFFRLDDGTRLAYEDYGRGEPIVFIASWALNTDMWEYQIPFFTERGYRCVALDRCGHGRSDRPSAGYDLDTFADDVAALIEHLDLRDVTLVGHSTGGMPSRRSEGAERRAARSTQHCVYNARNAHYSGDTLRYKSLIYRHIPPCAPAVRDRSALWQSPSRRVWTASQAG
jgi:pimeloyl-ACP methyl ester carboxylesterase